VVDQLDVDVFGLCDWNPHGMAIMLTYACGSARNVESYRFAVKRLRVAGLFHGDLLQQDDVGLSRCLIEQSDNDKTFLAAMLSWRVLELHPYLRSELLEMQRTGLKAELQAINQCGEDVQVNHLARSWALAAIVRAATALGRGSGITS
jgi:DNA topoisomerase VI subunit A